MMSRKLIEEKSVEEILNDASLKLLGSLNHEIKGKDVAIAFDYVKRCIRKLPDADISYSFWKSADELPPLHHVVEDDDEELLKYESSEKLLVYTENGRIVANVRYVKSENFVGWDDWSGGLFNTKVTHWMPQPKPPMEVPKNG